MSHTEIFTEIYDNNTWGGSGGGSMLSVNSQYIQILEFFMRINQIGTVIDYGCGDWQFSKEINWGKAKYLGIDCVQSVIDKNTKEYSSTNVSFVRSEKIDGVADLLLVKDVLQHWTNEQVISFLNDNLHKFKYIIITNNSGQTSNWEDSATPHIQTRPLSAKFYPLKNYNPTIILETNINEPKETSLITTYKNA